MLEKLTLYENCNDLFCPVGVTSLFHRETKCFDEHLFLSSRFDFCLHKTHVNEIKHFFGFF